MNKQLSIQEVSDRLELPKSTLRYWEKEFEGFVAPMRTPGGQRRYSDQDMKMIAAICNFKNMGLSLTQIKDRIQSDYHQVEELGLPAIDQLAQRIANTVKKEIYDFFKQGRPPDTPLDQKKDGIQIR